MIGGTGSSAVASIRAARLAPSSDDDESGTAFYRKLRLANTNTRLLLKLGQYRAARLLADSAAAWPAPTGLNDTLSANIDGLRTGLFSITGQMRKALELDQKYKGDYEVRLPSGETRKLDAKLGADVLRLATYTAFGCPRDSIIALDARIRTNLESVVASSQTAAFRTAILQRPLTLSVDVIGTKPIASLGPSSDPFISAILAVDAGNLAAARKLADSLAAFRAGTAAGEVTMDVVLQEAWLRTAIGDSAGAARSLDRALNGISRAPANLLEGSDLATALVRAMIMRARLAHAAHDDATARTWASAAQELWGAGDPEVKAVVAAAVSGS
jgi:hypothetical protein